MAALIAHRGYNRMGMSVRFLPCFALVLSCSGNSGHPTTNAKDPNAPVQNASQPSKSSAPVTNANRAWTISLQEGDHLRAAKVDQEGDIVWAPTAMHSQEHVAQGLSLIKSDKEGNIRWARHLSDNTEAFAMAILGTASGNTLLSGSFAKTLTIDNQSVESKGDRDAFVAMFTKDGKLRWLRSLGGLARESATHLAISDDDTQIVIGGFAESSFRFAGQNFPARGTASDGFIASFDGEGTPMWAKRYRGIGVDRVEGLAFDQEEITVLGIFSSSLSFPDKTIRSRGGYDIFCARYTASGAPVWQRSWGSEKNDYARAISLSEAGSLVIVAKVEGAIDLTGAALPAHGQGDIVVWAVDAYGSPIRSIRIGGPGDESPETIFLANTIAITGSFRGPIDLGFGPQGGVGQTGRFRLDLEPGLIPATSQITDSSLAWTHSSRGATLYIGQSPASLRFVPSP